MAKKKQHFEGLTFNYYVDGKPLFDKYKTIDELVNTRFPKNDNPLSPVLDTKIINVKWYKRHLLKSWNIVTLKDLIDLLSNESTDNVFELEMQQHKAAPKHTLIRKETYSIDEVRQKVKDVLFENDKRIAKVEFNGDWSKGNSQRYQTFFTKGCKCARCGIEGKYFAKEKHFKDRSYHLNLYAVDDNGNEVLMTKDHIIPQSKGGGDDISNYQTMCEPCNKAKGSKIED